MPMHMGALVCPQTIATRDSVDLADAKPSIRILPPIAEEGQPQRAQAPAPAPALRTETETLRLRLRVRVVATTSVRYALR